MMATILRASSLCIAQLVVNSVVAASTGNVSATLLHKDNIRNALGGEQENDDDSPGSTSYILGALGFFVVFGCAFLLVCGNITRGIKDVDVDSEKAVRRSPGSRNAADYKQGKQAWVCPASVLLGTCELAEARAGASRNSKKGTKAVFMVEDPHTSSYSRSYAAYRKNYTKVHDVCSYGHESLPPGRVAPPRRVVRRFTTSVLVNEMRTKPLYVDSDVVVGDLMGSATRFIGHAKSDDCLPPFTKSRVCRQDASAHTDPPQMRTHNSCPNLMESVSLGAPMQLNSASEVVQHQVTAAADAKSKVHTQLKSTLHDDVELRRKTFKFLCARWHPDKHLLGDAEFATDVFQYIQEQKSWYLDPGRE